MVLTNACRKRNTDITPHVQRGQIVGHFVKYAAPISLVVVFGVI